MILFDAFASVAETLARVDKTSRASPCGFSYVPTFFIFALHSLAAGGTLIAKDSCFPQDRNYSGLRRDADPFRFSITWLGILSRSICSLVQVA